MKVLIILLLTLSAGFAQKEYQLKDLIYENGIFSNSSSEELVNGTVYQNFKENSSSYCGTEITNDAY